MILIGLGANLPSPEFGPPRATIQRALEALESAGVVILARSDWYSTAPVPASDQPRYVNLVAAIGTDLAPDDLMRLLHQTEDRFGRVRGARNAARVIDIDLLDYDGETRGSWPLLPHPRMTERAFVLVPLRDIAPEWRDPVSGTDIDTLIAAAPDRDGVRAIDNDEAM
ncbi:MAG: 2-amino-4-hydroxy-6-hydroxymethyldihydropteridine diphosphokinase [Alphaproteobacteria bacterium]|nr:2-amino-4-hydroxy-6-hydroxymethyldihydropteridine diphosphokinase [Alphaproteobacteria bacterium]